jgi:hypothetical protein
MIEHTGNCSNCMKVDILNVKGGVCFRCWSDLTVHELEEFEREQIESEEE